MLGSQPLDFSNSTLAGRPAAAKRKREFIFLMRELADARTVEANDS